MSILSGWAQQLIYLAMFATIIQALLPDNEMRNYIKMVLGLVLVVAVISPLFNLLKGNDWLEILFFTQPLASSDADAAIAAGVSWREQTLANLVDAAQKEVADELVAVLRAIEGVAQAQVNLGNARPLVEIQAKKEANISQLTSTVRELAAAHLGVERSLVDVSVQLWH